MAVALRLVLLVALATGTARADDGLALVDQLASTDREALRRTVTAIEAARRDTPDLDEALFAAARLCEDTLADPARALALYDRLVREFPDARRSSAARTRADLLRTKVGAHSSHAREAAELARLVADADRLPAPAVQAQAERLAAIAWPGAPDAGLWLAEWLRRHGRFDEAAARYADVVQRHPDTAYALAAIRGGAGVAIEAGDWDRAEQLAHQLPVAEEIDRVMREELVEAAARGRRRGGWFVLSALVLALVVAGLVASLVEAMLRGRGTHRHEDRPARREGDRDPSAWMRLRPPIEVSFLVPVAAVLVGVALTTHELIAPAVFWLCIGGLVLTWLSGAGLETLRAHGRAVRGRAVAHALACFVGVFALLYILLENDNLLDMIIETVRFGPSG